MFGLPYHLMFGFLFIGLFVLNISGSFASELPRFKVKIAGDKVDEGWRFASADDVDKWQNYLRQFGYPLSYAKSLVSNGRLHIYVPTTLSPQTTRPSRTVLFTRRPTTMKEAPVTRRPATEPSKQDYSDCKSNRWILQNSNLCFGPETGKYGLLTMKAEGILKAMKFVHNSGTIVCKKGPASYWGCGSAMISVVITDHKGTLIMPDYVGYSGWSDVPGYNSQNKTLVLLDDKKRTYMFKGQVVKVYSSYKHFSWEKTGQVCAQVYAMFD